MQRSEQYPSGTGTVICCFEYRSEIQDLKTQIPNNIQIQNSNLRYIAFILLMNLNQTARFEFWYWVIAIYLGFGIWCLKFSMCQSVKAGNQLNQSANSRNYSTAFTFGRVQRSTRYRMDL